MAVIEPRAPSVAVLLFAKHPTPGAVKTRLMPALSAERAAAVHEALLRFAWQGLGRCAGIRPILVFSPDDRRSDILHVLGKRRDAHEAWAQGTGDLGERLSRAFGKAFERGFRKVLAIGTDSPTMPDRRIDEAVELLDTFDAVLGPAPDGGYYLIGLARGTGVASALFEGIEWGTERVAAQTRSRAAEASIRLAELAPCPDVDRPADLLRAYAKLVHSRDAAVAELRRALQPAVNELTSRVQRESDSREAPHGPL